MSRHTEDNPFDEPRSKRLRERGRRAKNSGTNHDSPEEASNTNSQPRRRRRWPYVLLFLLAFIFFLPNLVGWFGLQQHAIDYALKDFKGTVSADTVSLGWLQPITIGNLSAVDETGQPILQVEAVKTEKPLYAFLSSDDYGKVAITNPVAYLYLRPDGSNLEDAIANYIPKPSPLDRKPNPDRTPETTSLPKVAVEIQGGAAIITTSSSDDSWQVESLDANAVVSGDVAPVAATGTCQVTALTVNANGQSEVNSTGSMILKMAIDRGRERLTGNAADLELETTGLPVSVVAPIAQRFIGPANAVGSLDSKIVAAYNGRKNEVVANFQSFELSGAGLAAPEILGDDQFYVESVSGFGKMQASPEMITAEKFLVATDFGKVKADGHFDFRQLSDLANVGQGGRLLGTPFQMDGEVDLAKLAQLLPSTLHIHQDVAVDSGTARFQVGSQNDAGSRRLVVNLDTVNINARRGVQPIVWQKPLRIVGTIQETNGAFAIEKLECQSDFLNINGRATLQGGVFKAEGDLSELVKRVSQFVDLGEIQVAGKLDGEFGWQVAGGNAPSGSAELTNIANRPIQISGSFNVNQPVIALPGVPRWETEQVVLQVSAAGQSNAGKTLSLSQGGVQIDIGPERVIASLAQPVTDAFTTDRWLLDTRVTGGLDGWLSHVRNFVDIGDVRGAGQLDLGCLTSLGFNAIELDKMQFEVQEFGFQGYGVTILEPRIVGTGKVGYDFQSGITTVPQATLAGKSLTATSQDIRFACTDVMKLDGRAAFKADVNQVADWIELSPTPDSVFWFGVADGTIQFSSGEMGTSAVLDSKITDMIAAQQVPQERTAQFQQASASTGWAELWREPNVDLKSQFTLANDFNAIAFDTLKVKSESMNLNTRGTIEDLSQSMIVDLQGNWQPNFEKVNSLLAAYTGGALLLSGNEDQNFNVRGPIFDSAESTGDAFVPAALTARAGLKLNGGSVVGIPIGACDFAVNLNQQIANLKTSGIPFSGGVISVNPRLDLRSANPLMLIGQSRLLDQVALTPETCRTGLKFVAPLAADATAAQGKFTVDSQQIRVPIFDPVNLSARGTLIMQDVVIGAGPMAEQLLGTVEQLQTMLKRDQNNSRDLKTWIRMDEQEVPIVVQDQRVFHDGIKFSHDDIIIRTKGSVGFDQTLDMVAEIPIVDDWIAGKSYLAGLRGKSLSIPIGGTVSKPVLDRRAIQNLSSQLVRDTAGSAINNAISEKLAPKIGQYQNELNSKLGGEVEKLQNKFQDKLGGLLGDKLGLPDGARSANNGQLSNPLNPNGQPSQGVQGANGIQQKLEQKLQDGIKKGLGDLFK